MSRLLNGIAAAAVALMLVLPAQAQGPARTKVGTLTCDIAGGIGMIIASQKEIQCLYTPAEPGPREVYVGVIRKFGLDIGATSRGQLVWSVFAPTTARHAALAGSYVGASAEATLGAGLGANALVGGSNRTIALQPLSLQGQAGLNVAAGVTDLELRPVR
jgi:Protein of unknown function (DUF992)